MPKEKLTPSDRRALVLRALDGESPSALSKEYGVARSWVYVLVDEARGYAEKQLKEAEAELEFRRRVVTLISE